MRPVHGAIAVLLLGLAGALWQLKSAWGDAQAWEQRANAAESRADALSDRFDRLDRALDELNAETQSNRRALNRALLDLQNIPRSEGDSDEALSCLDEIVPRAIDDLLRRQPTPGGS